MPSGSFQVDIDRAGDGEGDDQRRRHEEVRLDDLMDAGLEVAVAESTEAATMSSDFTTLLDAGIERAGVADAGGAAVADGLEAELVEFRWRPVLLR
jgi:hypothetical protein